MSKDVDLEKLTETAKKHMVLGCKFTLGGKLNPKNRAAIKKVKRLRLNEREMREIEGSNYEW